MSKIEISIEDFDDLRSQINEKYAKIKELEDKLELFDKMEEKAINLAYFLLDKYIEAILRSMGFDEPDRYKGSINVNDVRNYFKNHYYSPDQWYEETGAKIKVDLETRYSKYIKTAIIRLSIDQQPEGIKKFSKISLDNFK